MAISGGVAIGNRSDSESSDVLNGEGRADTSIGSVALACRLPCGVSSASTIGLGNAGSIATGIDAADVVGEIDDCVLMGESSDGLDRGMVVEGGYEGGPRGAILV